MKIKLLIGVGVCAVLSALSVFAAAEFGTDMKFMSQIAALSVFVIVLLGGTVTVLMVSRGAAKKSDAIAMYLKGVEEGDFNSNRPESCEGDLGQLGEQVCVTIDALKKRIGFSEGVLNAIAEAYPFMTCDAEAKVNYVGNRLFKISGKTGKPEDYYGLTTGGYVYGDNSRKTRTDRVVNEGIRIEGETSFEGDGGLHELQFSGEPFYDLDNELCGALTIYFDLTEVKQQQRKIQENAERVANVAAELVDITGQVNSAAGVIASQIEEAAKGAVLQSERITETASAMEEMNSTTLEVARNAVDAADNATAAADNAHEGQNEGRKLVESIETMNTHATNLGTFMSDLGKQTDSVGSVITVIQDIADQTNLLALNAAIEAARAGEAGRGFAVVADEVRKLAEKTMTATDEVGTAIKAIQDGAQRSIEGVRLASNAVEQSTEIAHSSGQTLERIAEIVNGTSDQVQSIATAAEQQSATSEEINRAVDDINSIAAQTAEGMHAANEASSELVRMSDELNTLIKQLSS
ncbi:methyl-accepting chemotaxis protein [Maridesulfovibrio salexigens]|uniref:Methyl-accepting chemotaxis sensory transducer n=1 Tax=Maridesulfovibrio salexigens (strain ATCC 14822 / DSM 2638 / NCIMB 8403 / VKM B-1763) TaxID=526222 RepID=C6BVF6_MARSD|nr:methyl-accepting chemotaxis protein [Maridesulfovibrio salexigens]ACS80131.1 methyl-accepting chemotaxis sensory transducer [Maridesulfovibrio salexigens DSM 2638]